MAQRASRKSCGAAEPASKKAKAEVTVADEIAEKCQPIELNEQSVEKLSKVNEKIAEVEQQIAKEQLKVQMAYADKMKPLYEERDAEIASLFGWGKILSEALAEYLIPSEAQFIETHLTAIKVEDNIDENGSFEVVFTFDEESKAVFSPNVWRKKIIMSDDNVADLDKCEVTEITFQNKEQDPREIVMKQRKELEARLEKGEKEDAEELDDQDLFSVAEWFSCKDEEENFGRFFGEYVRNSVYADPLRCVFEADCDSDCDSDCGSDCGSSTGGSTKSE